MSQGYYRFPSIQGDQICFVSEDDLWLVNASGGEARRLTADDGSAICPAISPDGKWVAYSSQHEGYVEVYLISIQGGLGKRLTYLGARSRVLGWKNAKEILFYSNFEHAFDYSIYTVSIEGGEPIKVPVGDANRIHYGSSGAVVIGRCIKDSARWKRYRGGTAGNIWIKTSSSANFQKILNLNSDLADPMILGKRVYFISDHEGIGNLYSSDFEGNKIKKHSQQSIFYVRNAKTDGKKIVYHAGADLFVFDPKENIESKVDITYRSSFHQIQRKFDYPEECLHGFDLNPDGSGLVASFRGKLVSGKNWNGPIIQWGKRQGVRYRLPTWLKDKETIVATSDELNGEDRLLVINTKKKTEQLLAELDLGIVRTIVPSPKENKILVTNHKNELIVVDISKKKMVRLDISDHSRIRSASLSPDGKWAVYSYANSPASSIIRLVKVGTRQKFDLTKTVRHDHSPTFSADGKFIYFVGERAFLPQYDTQMFEMGFVYSSLLYAIPTSKNQKNPFTFEKEVKEDEDEDEKDEKKGKGKKKEEPLKIDTDGIENRIFRFNVKVGDYSGLIATKENLYYYATIRNLTSVGGDGSSTKLMSYDFAKLETEKVLDSVDYYKLSLDKKRMIYWADDQLFVTKAGDEAKDGAKNPYSPSGGEINLNRIKVEIDRREEWKQMYREAWLRQREHFWTEDMSGVDWQLVYKRYYPLLDRVCSRGEFSDLIWEMQGELATSHCYEFGGDYDRKPSYGIGKLGCSYQQSDDGNRYFIKELWSGDPSHPAEVSPLLRPGIHIQKEDQIVTINGRVIDANTSPREALMRYAGEEVVLGVRKKGKKKVEEFVVQTLGAESPVLYRQWVEKNREYVHQKSGGKIGYVHIPDMVWKGFAEFHRYYLTESQYDGLIVDVRYNSGGHVSQLILERLSRKRIGYDKTRWSKEPEPYPLYSVAGPMVALTNEWAGSDGDIFSHSFKLLKLGPLVGKRTWGGVIGITCQYSMVDGGVTSQPEYSFWFEDVGWGVENYGTDPDIEVDISPEDYENDIDPQLDKSIEIALESLAKNPVKKPNLGNRPRLTLPKL